MRTHLPLAACPLLALLPQAAAATCDRGVPVDEVLDALDAAETALLALDVDAFRARLEQAEAILPCVRERLEPSVVAEVHRLWGLRAFGERDPLASAAFAAARRLEPAGRFPEALIPTGSPVLEAYTAIDPSARATVPLDRPAQGELLVDGRPELERPRDWPVLVQHLHPEGLGFTAYLRPGAPLPAYEIERRPLGATPAARRRGRLVAGAGSALLVGGALYGLALHGHARYLDVERRPVPDHRLPGLRTRTNALVVASAVSTVAAAGTGVAVAMAW